MKDAKKSRKHKNEKRRDKRPPHHVHSSDDNEANIDAVKAKIGQKRDLRSDINQIIEADNNEKPPMK